MARPDRECFTAPKSQGMGKGVVSQSLSLVLWAGIVLCVLSRGGPLTVSTWHRVSSFGKGLLVLSVVPHA